MKRALTGRDCCQRVTFSLPNALGPGAGWAQLAAHLGIDPEDEPAVLGQVKARAADVRLRRHLPMVTPVVLDGSGAEVYGLTDDLDVTLAVLVRCSKQAFIRRHHAITSRARLERAVTLILPA